MLELRPNCECCGYDLAPESTDARICSFECTFCAACAEITLKGLCPNCGGELVARPRRPHEALATNPASAKRVLRSIGCPPPNGVTRSASGCASRNVAVPLPRKATKRGR